jgi:hypothetical protein
MNENALVGADDSFDEFVGAVQVRQKVCRRDVVDFNKYMLQHGTSITHHSLR